MPGLNTSATGGPLLPTAGGPAPLEGQALNRFLQTWVAGICGLDGSLVRPRWQPEPGDIPASGAWAAVGVSTRGQRGFPMIRHVSNEDALGHDVFYNQEWLRVLCSFYDLGSAGQADALACQMRDGLSVPQNGELLMLNNFAIAEVGELLAVPELLKARWYYRVDLSVTLNRAISRIYPIENLIEAEGTLVSETVSTPFDTGVVAS